MKKWIIIGALLATAGLAQAAFETTTATDGALLRGGADTNEVQGASNLAVKDAGTDGTISNGGLRISMLKFDLSGITGTVHAASVNLYQKEPDPYDFYVWTVDHDAPVPATADEIQTAYTKTADQVAEQVVANWNDETLLVEDSLHGEKQSRGLTLGILVRHEIHHRGQKNVVLVNRPVEGTRPGHGFKI